MITTLSTYTVCCIPTSTCTKQLREGVKARTATTTTKHFKEKHTVGGKPHILVSVLEYNLLQIQLIQTLTFSRHGNIIEDTKKYCSKFKNETKNSLIKNGK